MESKRFSKNDSGFVCAHCGKKVEPLGYTSRNHCPFCLWSLHVDENPGDRACECGGEMEPDIRRARCAAWLYHHSPLREVRCDKTLPHGA